MVQGSMKVVKYLLFAFNLVFWLTGVALLVVGILLKTDLVDKLSDILPGEAALAPIFIIILGCVVTVIGFVGCCGAIKENYFMITTYAVLLVIICILEIAGGITAYALKSDIEDQASDYFTEAVADYGTDDSTDALVDSIQQSFECCGAVGPEDYILAPDSCYVDQESSGTEYTEGCVDALQEFIEEMEITGIITFIVIAFIQCLGIVLSCCMMRGIKGEYQVV